MCVCVCVYIYTHTCIRLSIPYRACYGKQTEHNLSLLSVTLNP